jgi:hypothetical protein
MTVFDTAPRSDGRSMKDGEQWYHYGLQVKIRANSHPSGLAQAFKTKQIMDENPLCYRQNLYNFAGSLFSYFFSCFTNAQITYAGRETSSSKRYVFTINCYCPLKRIQ